MRKRILYFIRSAYSVFIRSHILDFALILEGRQVIFLVLRALKSLQWDDRKVCRVSIKGRGTLKYYRRKSYFS